MPLNALKGIQLARQIDHRYSAEGMHLLLLCSRRAIFSVIARCRYLGRV